MALASSQQHAWQGPYLIRTLRDRPAGVSLLLLPPESGGLYCLTKDDWHGTPPMKPLIFGMTEAAKSGGLRGRVPDLLSCLDGFWGPTKSSAGRHNPGCRCSEKYLRPEEKNPSDLYIAWLPLPGMTKGQIRALEKEYIERLKPEYNE